MHFDINLTNIAPGRHLSGNDYGNWSGPGIEATLGSDEARCASNGNTMLIVAGTARLAEISTSLTPVQLLERYAKYGKDIFSGLLGNFAIAIIDAGQRRVLLANDRMSVHGWCYRIEGEIISFSDRADQIGHAQDISRQAVLSYLLQHVIPSPETIYDNVSRLPPAHRLLFSTEGSDLAPFWAPCFVEPVKADFSALKEEFRGLIKASVERELATSQVRGLGTFLSGGTDSSTVSGVLSKLADQPIRAYSIGFDVDGYDEMEYARIAARHFGLDHREYYLTPEDVRTGMPLVATHYDQPFGNSSAVAAYHCARVAHEEGISTLLAGDGGDELFGGNARYAKQRVFGWYGSIPSPIRRYGMEPLLADNPLATRIPLISKAASYIQQARVPMPDRLNMYNLLQRIGLQQVLTDEFLRQVDVGQIQSDQQAVYNRCSSPFQVNRMLAFDWKYTLADNDLPKVCGTSALAGINVAFPLLADELIDFSLRLPAEYKLKGLQLRWFFKEALRDFLPEPIITKKKQGFGLPFGVWALRHDALRRLATDALGSFAERGVIRKDFIKRLQEELLPAHPAYYGELAWIITMFEFWLRDRAPEFRLEE
jgi:asparagine synthase (glutamine-hydrolysing)